MQIDRAAQRTVKELSRGFPVIAITGPRQSGKTTLAKDTFPDKPYVSLEDPDQRAFASEDPRRFLSRYGDGAVLDEVQRVPELFSYLQTLVDADKRPGLFILTGSSQFDVISGITQSLAGRVALVPLLPFSLDELQKAGRGPRSLEELLFTGLYPPIYDRDLDSRIWLGNYVQTYLERDVRQMINVRDLSLFQRFLHMCAARTGQLLNLSALASDCGTTHNTARAWLSVLEASYLVHTLKPYHRNFDKRVVKTPKLYFLDPGLASWLLGIQEPQQLATHPMRGALFETLCVSEFLKGRYNRALTSNLFFWKGRSGREVDVLVEGGLALVPIEIKSAETVASDFFRGLEDWSKLAGPLAARAWLVYGGNDRQSREQAEVLPWRQIGELVETVVAR